MTNLPVIVGFGGYNSSGRSSFHHGYRRTVLDSINQDKRVSTLLSLASLMKLVKFDESDETDKHYVDQSGERLNAQEVADKFQATIEQNTLVRRIHDGYFDVDNVPTTRDLELQSTESAEFTLRRRDLPNPAPSNWQVKTIDDKTVKVVIEGNLSVKMQSFRRFDVQSAGILPTGFEPSDHYNSRFHPKGLQLSVLGASDAINSIGISWTDILAKLAPDEVAVYSSSAMGQADEFGAGGYMQARLRSERPTSKQLPLSLNTMPADFVNAYVCGNVGTTGAMTGACASFLYNLRLAVDDIACGRHRVVICGSSETPVTPEVMEGYSAMSALGTDERLAKLDNTEHANHRRASRPFGDNVGFTIAESCQYFVLMDDALALELGAQIYGAVTGVFVNADGFKKSISSPGAGNYVTLAKAVGSARAILGDEAVKQRSFVQAHGSSTPQNRITESMILDKVAKGFGITDWPITAIKAYVGHPLAPASGDQLASTLGVFADGVIPGIKTTEKVADDVVDERLDILLKDKRAKMDVAFLNSKGFGGNNATATVIAPHIVETMLSKRHGPQAMKEYQDKRELVRETAQAYNQKALNGDLQVIYNFGENILEDHDISINENAVTLQGFSNPITLEFENPYLDMN